MSRYREAHTKLFKVGSYYYFWYWDGDTRRKKSTGTGSRKLAKERQLAFLQSLPSSGTVRAYLQGWFDPSTCPWTRLRRQAGASVSDDYLENRRGYLKNHILPAFGDWQLSALTTGVIETWLYSLPLANQTRRHIYNTLNDIYEYAVKNKDVLVNPVSAVEAPVVSSRSRRKAFVGDEIQKLLRGARTVSNRAFLAIWTLYASGIRSGELRALRASDVLPESCLWVRSAVKRGGNIGEPKTEYGVRIVPIPKALTDTFAHYIEAYHLSDDSILFAVNRRTVSWWVQKAKELEGIQREGLSAHSLRHSYRSLMNDEVPESILHDIMGHSGSASSRRYDQRWKEKKVSELRKHRRPVESLTVDLSIETRGR